MFICLSFQATNCAAYKTHYYVYSSVGSWESARYRSKGSSKVRSRIAESLVRHPGQYHGRSEKRNIESEVQNQWDYTSHPQHRSYPSWTISPQVRHFGMGWSSSLVAGSIAACACNYVLGISLVLLMSGQMCWASIDFFNFAATLPSQLQSTSWSLGIWT